MPAFDHTLIREVNMSHPKIVFVLAPMLILISLLCTAVPASSPSANRFPVQTVDQEKIDAYIQSRMRAAHIPGLAWLIVSRLFHTPMATISLFTPDVFLSIVLITGLGFGWALARTILTLRPAHMAGRSSGSAFSEAEL